MSEGRPPFASSREQFAKAVIDQIRGYEGIASAGYGGGGFEVVYECRNGSRGTVALSGLYQRFGGAPGPELSEVISDLVESVLTDDDHVLDSSGVWDLSTWEGVAPLLRPVVRAADACTVVFDGVVTHLPLLSRPAMPCLAEMVVIDLPSTLQYVTTSNLEDWGVDSDRVFATARGNISREAEAALELIRPNQSGNCYLFGDNGPQATALPLLEGWLERVGARAGTSPIVFVPDHTTLAVGIPGDEAGLLDMMVKMGERYDGAAKPLSSVPYSLGDLGTVVPLESPSDYLVADKMVKYAQAKLVVDVYTRQSEALREASESVDYCAPLMAMEAPDDTVFTVTTWTDGIVSLLPQADRIAFMQVDENLAANELFTADWADVETVVDLLPVPGFDPPRFRVADHPSSSALAYLAAAVGTESTPADDGLSTWEDVSKKDGATEIEKAQPPPGQFSLWIAGYGVEAKLNFPVGIVPLENGSLLLGNMTPEQVAQRGPDNLQNAVLTPGKPPAGALEMRRRPGRSLVTYSSGEEGTTELVLGDGGMDSYGGLFAEFRAADHPAHWTIVTNDYEIRWPAGFTLMASGDLKPRSWPYEFGFHDAGHLLFLQGPLTGLEEIPVPDQLVAPGMEEIASGPLEGTHVIWFEHAYRHGGDEWRQRFYYIPFASDPLSIYALRAQATEAVAAEMFEAADLIATSFRARG